MSSPYRKKLIEVALPLDVINFQSAREKSIRHGHPSTLHLWWARRPLATCRAVLFASLIDDPSEHRDRFPDEEAQEDERKRLFSLIEEMVDWDNANKEETMRKVREEILVATGGNPPPVLDPFAGGGSIPLEAQRLGLEPHASDLNPVAVLLNKALIEIPPKFASLPPINPDARENSLLEQNWQSAQGLAEDIRYYGKWMRDVAERRIGHIYPKVTLPKEYGGNEANVIAWIWARTVTCPNNACNAVMPLITSFWLSKKKGKETWVSPEVDRNVDPPVVHFRIQMGEGLPPDPPKMGRGGYFKCLCCGNIATEQYIKSEGAQKRFKAQLVAIVAEGKKGRVYLPPTNEQNSIPAQIEAEWKPEQEMPANPRWFSPPVYGMTTYGDIFSPRQLHTLNTLSKLIGETRDQILKDASLTSSLRENALMAYADAVITYLALAVNRSADYWSTLCSWHTSGEKIGHTFGRQALPMIWDFAEANPFSDASGNFYGAINWIAEVIKKVPTNKLGNAKQLDAASNVNGVYNPLISTDPPYYDNIGYADLSDFFYVWLRRSLRGIYPDLFRTMLVPKAQELVATPYRFGGDKHKAEEFFEQGLEQAFARMHALHNSEYPLTVYYAFKQAEGEVDKDGLAQAGKNANKVIASTGWETMLEGLIRSGFTITGTWPMRTEMMSRSIGLGTNALASSIVLVCRPRSVDAPTITRLQFLTILRTELPDALRKLQHGGIAPVDLAQASIGPGMAIYSRYSKVREFDGTPLSVRTALQLINMVLDDVLTHQEGEYDAETRWAIAWFEEYALNTGEYGRAETLSKAKNTTVQTLIDAGLLEAKSGKVRLLKPEELTPWSSDTQKNLTTWAAMQYLLHALESQGEEGAAELLHQFGEQGEYARDLAYRLYTVCERKGWASQAQIYNTLVTAWSEVNLHAQNQPQASAQSLWDTTEW